MTEDMRAPTAATSPLDPTAATQLGLRALRDRNEQDALPHVRRAAETWSDPRLLHVLGLLHRALGDLAPALAAFDRALVLAPATAKLMHARALTTLEGGLPSVEWFVRARALAPTDSDVLLGQTAALAAEHGSDEADTLLTGILRQQPGWIAGHVALVRLRFSNGSGSPLAELDRALRGAPADPRLHHLKIMALYRAGWSDAALAAVNAAEGAATAAPQIAAAAAIVASEYRSKAEADAAFASIDPTADSDVFVHWLRHLLRNGEAERVSALAGTLPPAAEAAAWPYLSLAWRLLGDPRQEWLNDDRLVRIIDFGEDWPPLEQLAETLRGLHRHRAAPLEQSLRGGTQTDGHLLQLVDPVIAALRARLLREITSYAAGLTTSDPSHPLTGRVPRHPRFVGSWSVKLVNGGFHVPHVHHMGWLSSAFYVGLPPQREAEAGWLVLDEPPPSLGLDLPPLRTIEPRRGRLALFPSTRWHGTRPFSEGERLTVAFDVG